MRSSHLAYSYAVACTIETFQMEHFVVTGAAGELRGCPAGMSTAVQVFPSNESLSSVNHVRLSLWKSIPPRSVSSEHGCFQANILTNEKS